MPSVPLDLTGRRALVTGASGGIGMAIARAVHGRGASLTITGRRVEELERLATELGERVDVVPADLTLQSDLEELLERAGAVEVLVANAAVPGSGRLDEYTPGQIDRAIDVNLRAPMQISRALVPGMAERRFGRLVYISSMSGKIANAYSSIYSATKFGLRGFALSLREEVRREGIGVSVVFPGFIRDAGMFAESGLKLPSYVGTNTPQDVADAVLKGIDTGRAEIDVAPVAMRLSALLAGVAPAPVASISQRLGGAKIGRELAEGQREKR
jgi:uncharacterized protein